MLMPLAIAVRLRTTDMRPVYDGFAEEFTMRMRVWAAAVLLALGVGTMAATVQNQSQPMPVTPPAGGISGDHGMSMGKPAVPAGPLKITVGDKSAEWTPATLAALPHQTVTVYNEHAKASQTYSGVPLIELLKPLGVAEKPHGKDLRLYVVAEGSDGYQVVYSVGEVTPDLHDGTVLVADAMDGKAIGDSGPLQLVATGEKRPARWVRNLTAIRVRTAE
jgi:hypothetical protein